jgi:hypothetical protein
LAGLLVYLFISPDPANQSQIGKAFLSFAATVVAISRVLHGNTTVSDQEYLAAYGDILNDVFSGNKKALRKLLKGIRLYNQNRFAGALRTLTSLKENCVSDHEHAVVLFLSQCATTIGDFTTLRPPHIGKRYSITPYLTSLGPTLAVYKQRKESMRRRSARCKKPFKSTRRTNMPIQIWQDCTESAAI